MKFLYTLVCCFLAISSYAKDINVVVYSDYTVEGFVLYATNKEDFPVEIEFNFTLENLAVVGEESGPIIIPPRVSDFKLLKLNLIDKLSDYSFDFTHTLKNANPLLEEDESVTTTSKNIISGSQKNDISEEKNVSYTQVSQQFNTGSPKLGERRSKTLIDDNFKESPEAIDADANELQNIKLAEIAEKAKQEEEEEEARLAEVIRQANIEVEARLEEVARQAKIEDERLAEVARLAKIEEEVRLAEDARQAKIAEEKRIAELERQAKIEEEKRLAALAEKERLAQEKRLAEIERRAKLDAERRIEEVVKQAKMEEEKRIAAVVEEARKEEQRLVEVNSQKKDVEPTSVMNTRVENKIAQTSQINAEENKSNPDALMKMPTLEITGKYDIAYKYSIPLTKGAEFTIAQGYQGATSHQNKFAVDFAVDNGTKVHAARDGMVVYVEASQTKGCGTENCVQFDNLIIIEHPDGSFAKYAHLKENGSNVKVGETVSQGQLIGYSGDTGWTADPSLHFEVFVQKENNIQKTIKTNFKMGDGSDYGLLFEQQNYTKEY